MINIKLYNKYLSNIRIRLYLINSDNKNNKNNKIIKIGLNIFITWLKSY